MTDRPTEAGQEPRDPPELPAPPGEQAPLLIRKYSNRRLYDTSNSSYVTLFQLAGLARRGVPFRVEDARTGEDLTRQILVQIIMEQEGKEGGMLPLAFLWNLVSLYNDGVRYMVPDYLDLTMDAITRRQRELREMLPPGNPANPFLKRLEALNRQGMSLFFQPGKLMGSLASGLSGDGWKDDPPPPQDAPRTEGGQDRTHADELGEIRRELAILRKRVNDLDRNGS